MTAAPHVQRLLDSLGPGNVRTREAGFQARCPAHEDERASLSVDVGTDGRILLHCHAGCDTPAIVRALGLTMGDLFPPREPDTHQPGIAAVYPYRDEDGRTLFEVVRLEPKGFRQRKPDGKGGYEWKLNGVRRVPYRLPELLADDPDEPVCVVEGEKDADALARLGFAVTTNPAGAGKWNALDAATVARALGGRNVVGIPDNDEPGEAHARDVVARLTGVARSVGILRLEGLPPKGDVSDWLAAGGEPADLWEMVRAAVGTADRVDAAPGQADGPLPARPRFEFIASADFAGADYRPEWLVKGALVKGQPAVIAGPSKSLKTGLAIDLAVSLASGEPFLSRFQVARPVRVAVVSGESGPATLQETAARMCKAKGLNLANLGDRLTWCFDLPTLTSLPVMAEFADALAGVKADVTILDPLYLCLGDVDARNLFEMGAVLRGVAELLLKAGHTPVILHHFNRLSQVGDQPELSHIAYSGLEQFARQFLLLNRREPYRSDGRHDLWLRIGGSAGHGGLYALHVVEGVVRDDFAGRTWEVTVSTAGEVAADRIDERDAAKQETARRQLQKDEANVLDAIDREVRSGKPGATINTIRKHYPALSGTKAKEIVGRLVEAGTVEPVPFQQAGGKGAQQDVTGYRRVARNGWIPGDLFHPSEGGLDHLD